MLDDEGVAELADRFKLYGGFVLDTENGRLSCMDIAHLVRHPAVLVSYEGGGSLIFEFDRPLNAFRMIGRGFPPSIAAATAELVNTLFYFSKETT